MALPLSEEQISDDEVFFGKLSLKEVKKHILWNRRLQVPIDDCEGSVKIIETHSAPDLNRREITVLPKRTISNTSLSPTGSELYSGWDIKPNDDSFLRVEKMVAEMSVSPNTKKKSTELDNTLEIIDYILNHGPSDTEQNSNKPSEEKEKSILQDNFKLDTVSVIPGSDSLVPKECKIFKCNENVKDIPLSLTPAKCELKYQRANCLTPRTPVFKTPGNPLSSKKPSSTSLKKTPGKNAAYQHIASPVATYIKNCPVAPLVKDVRPMKPLPGTSSIPKLFKNSVQPNKENVNLPAVAYRSAKKTQVIELPDEDKLPQSHWMKKITSSLPRPVIMKHDHREVNLAKRILGSRQEDSFADLSLCQADVSLCTQKSAFIKPKKAV